MHIYIRKALTDVFSLSYIYDLFIITYSLDFLLGSRPVRNRNHIPKSDGCGSLGFEIASEYLPLAEMTKCCDSHDICYDTCNSGKEVCDLDFKRCLYNYCDTYKSVNVAGDAITKGILKYFIVCLLITDHRKEKQNVLRNLS